MTNPCLGCGACCTHFRVAFYWREAEAKDAGASAVPKDLTLDLNAQLRCMRGTEVKHNPKCVGLRGRVGVNALCSIHPNRPSTCRNFQASFENGVRNPRCDEARIAKGLRPLSPKDWPPISSESPHTPRPSKAPENER